MRVPPSSNPSNHQTIQMNILFAQQQKMEHITKQNRVNIDTRFG